MLSLMLDIDICINASFEQNTQFIFNDKASLGKKIAKNYLILRVVANFKKSTNGHP